MLHRLSFIPGRLLRAVPVVLGVTIVVVIGLACIGLVLGLMRLFGLPVAR